MNTHEKPGVLLYFAILIPLAALPLNSRAQSTLISSGSAQLTGVLNTSTGGEALNVSWFIVENTVSDVYTYAYVVNNPPGDVIVNNNGTPTTTPEIVNSLSLDFDATRPGDFISGTAPAGGTMQNLGTAGISWIFPPVAPGNSSGLLAFESDVPPTAGDAGVIGATLAGPSTFIPFGQAVPVPDAPSALPEPATAALVGAAGLMFWLRRVTGRQT